MSRRNYSKGAIPYEFVAVPRAVLQSSEWQDLPPSAKALAMDLAAQYTGKNNGRLCVAWEAMRKCGWKSKETLATAKRALVNMEWCLVTRKGHAPRTAEWVGFTWWKLDWEKSMDVGQRCWPHLNFMCPIKEARIDPNRGREQSSRQRIVRYENRTDDLGKPASGGTKAVPMEFPGAASSVRDAYHAP